MDWLPEPILYFLVRRDNLIFWFRRNHTSAEFHRTLINGQWPYTELCSHLIGAGYTLIFFFLQVWQPPRDFLWGLFVVKVAAISAQHAALVGMVDLNVSRCCWGPGTPSMPSRWWQNHIRIIIKNSRRKILYHRKRRREVENNAGHGTYWAPIPSYDKWAKEANRWKVKANEIIRISSRRKEKSVEEFYVWK